jgi:biotin transport system substrate-specific component
VIAATRPLVFQLVPDRALWRFALVVAGSLLLALVAQVAIPLPGRPVPVTGQTFGVLLIGATLGARLGAGAVLLYLLEGVVAGPLGINVFAPGASVGLARLGGPTGGFLIGFVLAAFVVGYCADRGWERRLWSAVLVMLVGEIVIYAVGLPWLARFVPVSKVLDAGFWPFVIGDLYKLALAALALPTAWRFVGRRW